MHDRLEDEIELGGRLCGLSGHFAGIGTVLRHQFSNRAEFIEDGCGVVLNVPQALDHLAVVKVDPIGNGVEPRAGAASPRVAEFSSGMLNAIGLANPGVEAVRAEHLPWLAKRVKATRVLVNVVKNLFDFKVQTHENTNRNHGRNRQVDSSQTA